jgi:hypothetical protein
MEVNAPDDTATVARVLVVADWAVDPYGVIAACRRRAGEGDVRFGLVVPAWLHGLDWVGDPHASRPCAARQLEALARMTAAAGLQVELEEVGDPDPTSAIEDARAGYAATEILVCSRPRRLRHPFDLVHRVRRATGLEVRETSVRARPASRRRRRWSVLCDGGHCAADAPQPA